jgi:hypothetical protein
MTKTNSAKESSGYVDTNDSAVKPKGSILEYKVKVNMTENQSSSEAKGHSHENG